MSVTPPPTIDDAKLRVMTRLTQKLMEEKQQLEEALVEMQCELECEQNERLKESEFFLQEHSRMEQELQLALQPQQASSKLEVETLTKEFELQRAAMEKDFAQQRSALDSQLAEVQNLWKQRELELSEVHKRELEQLNLSAELDKVKHQLASALASVEPLHLQIDRLNEQLDEERRLQLEVKQKIDNDLGEKYFCAKRDISNLNEQITSMQDEFVLAKQELTSMYEQRELELQQEIDQQRYSNAKMEQEFALKLDNEKLAATKLASEQNKRQVAAFNAYEEKIQQLERAAAERQREVDEMNAACQRELALARDEVEIARSSANQLKSDNLKLEQDKLAAIKLVETGASAQLAMVMKQRDEAVAKLEAMEQDNAAAAKQNEDMKRKLDAMELAEAGTSEQLAAVTQQRDVATEKLAAMEQDKLAVVKQLENKLAALEQENVAAAKQNEDKLAALECKLLRLEEEKLVAVKLAEAGASEQLASAMQQKDETANKLAVMEQDKLAAVKQAEDKLAGAIQVRDEALKRLASMEQNKLAVVKQLEDKLAAALQQNDDTATKLTAAEQDKLSAVKRAESQLAAALQQQSDEAASKLAAMEQEKIAAVKQVEDKLAEAFREHDVAASKQATTVKQTEDKLAAALKQNEEAAIKLTALEGQLAAALQQRDDAANKQTVAVKHLEDKLAAAQQQRDAAFASASALEQQMVTLNQDLAGDREAIKSLGLKLQDAKLEIQRLEQEQATATETGNKQQVEAFRHVQECNAKLNEELASDREALQLLSTKLAAQTEEISSLQQAKLASEQEANDAKAALQKATALEAKTQREMVKCKDRLFILEKSRKTLEEEDKRQDELVKAKTLELETLRGANAKLTAALQAAEKERDALQQATGNNVIVSRLQSQLAQETALGKIRQDQLDQVQHDLREAHSQLDDLVMESSKMGKRLNEEQRKATAAREELEQCKKRHQQDLEDATAPSIRLGEKVMALTEALENEHIRYEELFAEMEQMKKKHSVMESSNV